MSSANVVIFSTYLAPLRDVNRIETELTELGRASLSIAYQISRESNNDLLAIDSSKHACTDHAGKLTRIPTTLLDAVKAAAR